MNTMGELMIEIRNCLAGEHIIQSTHEPRPQKETDPAVILEDIDESL